MSLPIYIQWEKKEEHWLRGGTGPISAESKLINWLVEHVKETSPFGNPVDLCFLLLSIEKSQQLLVA